MGAGAAGAAALGGVPTATMRVRGVAGAGRSGVGGRAGGTGAATGWD